MTDITLTNTDQAIIEDLVDALAAARVDGRAVFAKVVAGCSPQGAIQVHFTASPLAAVLFDSVEEHVTSDLRRGAVLNATLLLAVRQPTEAQRLSEIARLRNAAMNAVAAAPPADARAFAAGGELHRRIAWGRAAVDTTAHAPWAVCRLPVRVAYPVAAEDKH